jgi:tRNA A37 N6-isopentenylltransferase MiaA
MSLGGCSYNSFKEFYSSHRWQYSRRQRQWIKDPKSRAWKACEARRPRRADGSRMDGQYFPSMVREAVGAARDTIRKEQDALGGLYIREE